MRIRALLGPPLVLAAIWAAAIWWPAQMAISSANDELERSEADQELLVADIDRLALAIEEQPDPDGGLIALAEAIPGDADIEGFLDILAAEAERSGVLINLVTPTDIVEGSAIESGDPMPAGVSSVGISLSAEGDYAEVMAFTSGIQELPRLAVIDHVGMVSLDGDRQIIIVELTLRIFSNDRTTMDLDQ